MKSQSNPLRRVVNVSGNHNSESKRQAVVTQLCNSLQLLAPKSIGALHVQALKLMSSRLTKNSRIVVIFMFHPLTLLVAKIKLRCEMTWFSEST